MAEFTFTKETEKEFEKDFRKKVRNAVNSLIAKYKTFSDENFKQMIFDFDLIWPFYDEVEKMTLEDVSDKNLSISEANKIVDKQNEIYYFYHEICNDPKYDFNKAMTKILFKKYVSENLKDLNFNKKQIGFIIQKSYEDAGGEDEVFSASGCLIKNVDFIKKLAKRGAKNTLSF